MLWFDSGCTENQEHLLLFVQSQSLSFRVVIPKQYATSILSRGFWILVFFCSLVEKSEKGLFITKKGDPFC